LRLVDAWAIARCIRDPRFCYPLLTGTPDPVAHPVRPLRRALAYTLSCIVGNRLGVLLFGARRHWIMAIVGGDNQFLGLVMIDELLRAEPDTTVPQGARFLKRSELRLPLHRGDGELGFFLHPDARGRGLATRAMLMLLERLTAMRDADGGPLLRRVWAETGEENGPARRLLERMGLEPRPDLSPSVSHRFARDGSEIRHVHYAQPISDARREPVAPVRALLHRLHTQSMHP
jgi:RimJ/RimL family protein N-acetyltransferase